MRTWLTRPSSEGIVEMSIWRTFESRTEDGMALTQEPWARKSRAGIVRTDRRAWRGVLGDSVNA